MVPRDAHRWPLLMILALAAGCVAPRWPQDFHWVDLTHEFSASTVYWPTSERFELEVLTQGYTRKGYYYAANRFSTAEHGGTHIDAPVHFAEGRRSVDQIPLEDLAGPAVVVDVRAAALEDRDYEVSVADLAGWERSHGTIPDGAIVLLNTGYSRYWPDAEAYMGTAERGEQAVPKLRFPGLHPDAARWLVTERDIAAVGLDTPSIDYGQSTLFASHVALFERDVPAFENLTNLDALPAAGATVVALPMKIRGGTGAPLRIVACVPSR